MHEALKICDNVLSQTTDFYDTGAHEKQEKDVGAEFDAYHDGETNRYGKKINEHEMNAGTYQTFLFQLESLEKYITIIKESWTQYEKSDDIKLIDKSIEYIRPIANMLSEVKKDLMEIKKTHTKWEKVPTHNEKI